MPEKSDTKWHWFDWLFSHYRIAGALFSAFAILSVVWSAASCDDVRKGLVAFWSMAPPIWFFFEFHWARDTKDELELKAVKESQEQASKIWAGVVAALSVLYLKG